MLPKKYHAIIFISILVMLLLLGLHLLGIGYSGGPANARSVALARNSTSQTSSSSSTITPQVYRHPIIYDKLTGATNNQISEVLGAKQPADYPLDHYQQQQQQTQPANPHQMNPSQEDFFAQLQRQAPGFPRGHPLAGHMRPMQIPPPPPTPPMPTTQPPMQQQRPNAIAREDPLPSASSLSNNGAQQQQQRPVNLLIGQNQSQTPVGQQQQQPVYYTPPIFAYNNFDQSQRGPADPQVSGPFGFPSQAQYPPLGLPEPPISIDEYNARQNRLRQLNQQPAELQTADRYRAKAPPTGGYNQNLLADPQQQQRHKQQMLDRQLLFANAPFSPDPQPNPNPNQSPNQNQNQSALQQQYQEAALGYRPPMAPEQTQTLRAPYAAEMELKQSAQNRILPPANRIEPAKLITPDKSPNLLQLNSPLCARQPVEARSLELANSSAQMPSLFCNEDPEYPTKEIMRALEAYAQERSIEQLLPQLLVQLHSRPEANNRNNPMSDMQRQLALDSLQPSINALKPPEATNFDDQRAQQQQQQVALFPSANYEPLCRSNVFMAQPRRAKNLMGQWKVVVNLPGHKYRGIAVSQMLRVDECSRPNGECATPTNSVPARSRDQSVMMAKSRCLQHYENQRLVAWSHQQGLHLDIFRIPVACSCHIRR